MGDPVGRPIFDAETMAARARRIGIDAFAFVYDEGPHKGRPGVSFDGRASIVITDGGYEIEQLFNRLTDEQWDEIVGWSGVTRLLRAIRDWLWAARLMRLCEFDRMLGLGFFGLPLGSQPRWSASWRQGWPETVAFFEQLEAQERERRSGAR